MARFCRNTTTGAITQPAGAAGCLSETGAGPCADGHGLAYPWLGGGQPRREERLRRLPRQQRRGAPQPQHDHRGDHPARRGRRLHQRDGGGAVRRRPWARLPEPVAVSPDGKSVYVASGISSAVARLVRNRPPGRSPSPRGPPAASARRGRGPAPTAMRSTARLGGGQPRREERLRDSQRRRGAPQPQHHHRGDHPARGGRRLHQRDGGGALRRRPWARRPVGGGQPGRKDVYVASELSEAVVRLNRNTTTGAITQPAGAAGCISETGGAVRRRPWALRPVGRWRSAPTERASTSPRPGSDAVARFNRAP